MVDDAKEATGSMGDDTPLAVLSAQYRGLHHFFRQSFSQVTNPPIDSLREYRVMTLRTRLGNLGNILERNESQMRLLQLESPVLTNAAFAEFVEATGYQTEAERFGWSFVFHNQIPKAHRKHHQFDTVLGLQWWARVEKAEAEAFPPSRSGKSGLSASNSRR